MPVLSSAVSALSTFYQDSLDPFNADDVELSTIRLLAKLPTIAAYAYKKSIGQPFLYPDNSLGLIENFLRMTFGFPAEPYEVDPEMAARAGHPADPARRPRAELFDVHRPHGRLVERQPVRVDLRGHQRALRAAARRGQPGRAGDAAEDPERGDGDVENYVKRVKNKEDKGARLMGFGHRVYKNYDPRAKIVKQSADEILKRIGVNDPLLDIAKALEEKALADDYFIERKLYPNVDFYTGVIYRAMGFPTRMFTVLFALGRLPGWIAHWREMINDPTTKIGRPRQLYIGETERNYPA